MTCSTAVGHRLMKSGIIDRFSGRYPGLRVELIMTERLADALPPQCAAYYMSQPHRDEARHRPARELSLNEAFTGQYIRSASNGLHSLVLRRTKRGFVSGRRAEMVGRSISVGNRRQLGSCGIW